MAAAVQLGAWTGPKLPRRGGVVVALDARCSWGGYATASKIQTGRERMYCTQHVSSNKFENIGIIIRVQLFHSTHAYLTPPLRQMFKKPYIQKSALSISTH